MPYINKATIMGHVGQDPDIRTFASGDKVANLSIATTEKWKDKTTGEQKEKTEWHRVSVFGKLAEIVEKYVKKGSKLYIEGQLETRSWEQDGQKKYATEIILRGFDSKLLMLDSKPAEQSAQSVEQKQDDGEEIPF